MTPGARFSAVSNILSEVLRKDPIKHIATDKILDSWYRKNRYAGSKDRKDISDSIFGILRYYFILSNLINLNLKKYNFSEPYKLALIYYSLIKYNYDYVMAIFEDSPYAPKMNEKTYECLNIIKNLSFSVSSLKHNYPDWLHNEFYLTYEENSNLIYKSLLETPNVDVRVSKFSLRDKIYRKLLKIDNLASKTVYSPLGIRLSKRIPIKTIKELKKDSIEIQDEGSQLVTLLCGAKEDELIIDLCAGAGGKSLLISNLVSNVKIIATDYDSSRLLKIKKRNSWIKQKNNIEIHEDYENLNLVADRVICDVPCSGSGAWRRRPEEKVLITEKRFKDLLYIQQNILKKAAGLLKIGGELAYITCSLLQKENQEQVEVFLKNNSEFEIVDLKHSWNNIVKSDSWVSKNLFCQFLPSVHNCDGFFIALLRKFK